MKNFQEKCNLIWNIAELLRGAYKKEQYGEVILPMCVLRRFDCVLESTKEAVLKENENLEKQGIENKDLLLNSVSGQEFYNISKYDFEKLLQDSENIKSNFTNYINGFSPNAKEIIDNFGFEKHLDKLEENDLLFLIIKEFNKVDFHPDVVSNIEMGYIFEDLIRRFSEHGEAGDHYTPREVIKLMTYLLLCEDKEELTEDGLVVSIYDPACGSGGMLSEAEKSLKELNPSTDVYLFGQELNPESYAICKSDMLIKGQDDKNIVKGNSFTQDGHKDRKFRYMLSNPPFGVEWKKERDFILNEHETLKYDGRFGAGLPRVSDGALLFLQHMISKMKKDEKGSRISIVLNGSPLFTGDAGSGESEIRRWIIENDWLEGIVALPTDLFYNTGIPTYLWIISNRKPEERRGKIQLINATDFYVKMRKSLGNKRKEISEEQIREISRIYGNFEENEYCKIFNNEDFGYYKITVERPLRLSFKITEDRINNLWNEKGFLNLSKSKKKGAEGQKEIEEGKKLQEKIISILKTLECKEYNSREIFLKDLKELLKSNSIKLNATLQKAIVNAIGERDENAEICRDSKGNPEPDSELRDYEKVLLKEDIYEYFEREVKPHVPDAWIDESKTKIGYEIPFTRHFYKYTPLRSSEEIKKEIMELEQSLIEKLKRVLN
jgi:type I restriction enzyme M protein